MNVLFICGGAFVDLDQIIEEMDWNQMVGHTSEVPKEKEDHYLMSDLKISVKYGLIPEFIGRLPIVSVLEELTQLELVRVFERNKEFLLKQYRKLFLMEGAELHFTREAVLETCEQAIQMKTGARALRSIMENIMLDVVYDLPSIKEPSRVTISAAKWWGKGKAKVLLLNPPKKNAA